MKTDLPGGSKGADPAARSRQPDLGIYVHIPFCVRKCRYCDFLSFPAEGEVRSRYADACAREIRAAGEEYGREAGRRTDGGCGRPVDTVFLGGGTPSVLTGEELERIFRALHEAFFIREDAEVTVEINPGTLTEEQLPVIKRYVNRLSVGLQSASDEELASLGRIHRYGDFVRSWRMLEDAGIRNRNADLMFGIPGQTAESFERTLQAVLALEPAHISIYSLILEEGTELMRLHRAGALKLPDEETERRLQETAASRAEEAGLRRYEISNYARAGYESRHNSRYWKCRDYLGIGLGASSCADGARWKNTEELRQYLDALECGDPATCGPEKLSSKIRTDHHVLTEKERMEEFMFLGLRMTEGVSRKEFAERFGRPVEEVYGPVIRRLGEEGLLADSPERLFLTPYGLDVSNLAMAEFLLD